MNFVLSELIAGIGEVAIVSGLTQIVSVFDARIYRVLKAVGCNPQLIGRPHRIAGTMSYAGLFDTGEGLLQALQAFREELGIEAPEAKKNRFRVAQGFTPGGSAPLMRTQAFRARHIGEGRPALRSIHPFARSSPRL